MAEMHVEAVAVQDRRRAGVAVLGVDAPALSPSSLKTSSFQRILPSLASRHRARSEVSFVPARSARPVVR